MNMLWPKNQAFQLWESSGLVEVRYLMKFCCGFCYRNGNYLGGDSTKDVIWHFYLLAGYLEDIFV